jgi:DNA (cytosine-5)-methyltransferase 1
MSSALRALLPGMSNVAQKAPVTHLPERAPGSHEKRGAQQKMSSGAHKVKSIDAHQTSVPEFMSIDRRTGNLIDLSTLGAHLPPNARLLDLCCGSGLAAWGYWLSGLFSEIVGIDIDEQPAYPFTFIRGDAFKLDYDFLSQFDFIHASPPCQFYSKVTPKNARANHSRLIPAAHLMLQASGKPYVIENVEGSGHDLRPNLVIDGQAVGLGMKRIRYFHVVTLKQSVKMVSSSSSLAECSPHDSKMTRSDLISAFGIEDYPPQFLDKMTRYEMRQGIPPAMTRWIAESLFTNDKECGGDDANRQEQISAQLERNQS